MNSPRITNVLLSLLVVLVSTLTFFSIRSKPQKAPTVSTSVGYQRFVPIPPQFQAIQGLPSSNHFALDTKTGRLCKTYDWDIRNSDTDLIPVCWDLTGL